MNNQRQPASMHGLAFHCLVRNISLNSCSCDAHHSGDTQRRRKYARHWNKSRPEP